MIMMRSGLATRLGRWWRGERSAWDPVLLFVTLPLSVLYGALIRVRNLLYDAGLLPSTPPSIPVISVGNLAVGGTGKTPVAGWIVEELLRLGQRPALVARGYGADELRLHDRWHPNVPVIAAPRRADGVREAEESGCTVVVVDDGFQHRALGRTLDLVLLSPGHSFPVRLLPRGPFREPLGSLRRADLLLITRKEGDPGEIAPILRTLDRRSGYPPIHQLRLVARGWCDLDGAEVPPPRGRLFAVASVARPESFEALLRKVHRDEVEMAAYPDHHDYSRAEVEELARRAEGRTVVTTEKDAVKLAPFGDLLPGARVIPLRVAPSPELTRLLRSELTAALASGEDDGVSASETRTGGRAR